MIDGDVPSSEIEGEFAGSGTVEDSGSTNKQRVRPDKENGWSTLRRVPSLLFSRRWWWATLLVIGGMLVMARLGVWQLNRLEQRRAANTKLIQQLDAPPLHLTMDSLPYDLESIQDRLAISEGKFDYDSQVLLTQQNWQGRPGVHLITPLRLDGTDVAVLIDRGWIPAREAAAGDLRRYDDKTPAAIEGVITLSESLANTSPEPVAAKEEWYRVDIAAIESQVPYKLLPVYVRWLPESTVQELPYRAEREIDLSEGSHLSYAIQWFSFTFILGAGYIALIFQNERRRSLSTNAEPTIIDNLQEKR